MSSDVGKVRKVNDRVIKAAIRRQLHVFQRASASELRNEIRGHIEDEKLMEQISTAVKWRDLLAHRYLIQRIRRGGDRMFRKGTLSELIRLTNDFNQVDAALAEVWKARLHSAPPPSSDLPGPPEAFERAFQKVARSIFCGAAWSEEEDGELA